MVDGYLVYLLYCWWIPGMPDITGFAVNILACVLDAQRCTVLWSTAQQLGSRAPKQSLRRVLPGGDLQKQGSLEQPIGWWGKGRRRGSQASPWQAGTHGDLIPWGSGDEWCCRVTPWGLQWLFISQALTVGLPTPRVSTPWWAFPDEAAPVGTVILWKTCDFSGASDHRSWERGALVCKNDLSRNQLLHKSLGSVQLWWVLPVSKVPVPVYTSSNVMGLLQFQILSNTRQCLTFPF